MFRVPYIEGRFTQPQLTHWGRAKIQAVSLRWRHNGLDGVSDHQPHECLLNRLFGRRSKTTSKPRVTGLCAASSPGTGQFPAQRASNAENVSIWWRHHVAEAIFRNEIIWISNWITLKYIPNGLTDNTSSLGAMEHDPKFSVKVFFFADYSSMGCP